MYERTGRAGSGVSRGASRKKRGPASRPGGSGELRRRERALLIQLGVCLVLFFTVFLGKGVFPDRLVQLRSDVLSVISRDFDFRQALTELGSALSEGESVFSQLGEFCVQVFGAEDPEGSVQPVEFQPMDPNHARYQLRYTRMIGFPIIFFFAGSVKCNISCYLKIY